MSEHSSPDIKKTIKMYLIIGAALFVGTGITVWAAGVQMGVILGIIVAVIIATVKGTLVAGYFMHLFHERKLIYQVLILTFVFIVVMVGLFLFAYGDQQHLANGRAGQVHGIFNVPAGHVIPHGAGHGGSSTEHSGHTEH